MTTIDVSPTSPTLLPTSPSGQLARVGQATLSKASSQPLLRSGVAISNGTVPWNAAARGPTTRKSNFLFREAHHPRVEARREVALKHRELLASRQTAQESTFYGAYGAKGFRLFLRARFGSTLAGWRQLDSAGVGRLSFQEFCTCCRDWGFHGRLKQVWEELDANKSGFISLRDIDPKVDSLVGTFKLNLMYKYGDMLTAWNEGLGGKGKQEVTAEDVKACCQKMGLALDGEKVFRLMRSGVEGRGLTLADFDPTAHVEFVTLERGKNKAASSPLEKRSGPKEDAHWPSDLLVRKWEIEGSVERRGALWAKDRLSRPVANKALASPGESGILQGIDSLEGFKQVLKKRFGSLYRAWRFGLDVNDVGCLTFSVFCQAIRRLSLGGSLRQLWHQIDVEDNGFIELLDLDPKAHILLQDFRDRLAARWGNTMRAWLEAFDKNNIGHCSQETFLAVCKEINFDAAAPSLGTSGPGKNPGTLSGTLSGNFSPKSSNFPPGTLGSPAGALGRTDRELLRIEEREGEAEGGEERRGSGEQQQDREEEQKDGEKDLPSTSQEVDVKPEITRSPLGESIKKQREVPQLSRSEQLFEMLKPEVGRNVLVLQDIDTYADFALRHGDFRMLSEPDFGGLGNSPGGSSSPLGTTKDLSKLEMTLNERTQASYFFQRFRGRNAAEGEQYLKGCRSILPPEEVERPKEAFVALCRRRFGSVAAAWMLCLDAEQGGRLNHAEICKAARRLGFAGDLKELIKVVDSTNKGHICLADLDLEADQALKQFVRLVDKYCGGLDNLWLELAGKDLHCRLEIQDIAKACRILDYQGSPQKLMRCLLPSFGQTSVSIHDLEPLFVLTRKLLRGPRGAQPRQSLTDDDDDIWQQPSQDNEEEEETRPKATSTNPRAVDTTVKTVVDLRLLMTRVHGSTVAAWRKVLDSQCRGFVTFQQFLIGMPKCELFGNVKGLWKTLTKGKDALTFEDIDPRAQAQLRLCRDRLVEQYHTIAKAWEECLDRQKLGRLDRHQFAEALQHAQMVPEVDVQQLFPLLLIRLGQRSVTLEDLEALLVGLPPSQQAEMFGREVNVGFASAQAPARKTKYIIEKDRSPDTVVGFRKLLIANFGSLFSAWRRSLDLDSNGVVSQKDFSEACRRLGVTSTKTLWKELDPQGRGQIAFKELDPRTAEEMEQLQNALRSNFDHPREGWQLTFDKSKQQRVDKHAFIEGCKELGLKLDPKDFFKRLSPDPCRLFLVFEDLWVDLNPNLFASSSSADVKSVLKREARPHQTGGGPFY